MSILRKTFAKNSGYALCYFDLKDKSIEYIKLEFDFNI